MAALRAAADDPQVRAVASIAAVVDTADYVRRVAGFAPAARDGVMQFMGGAPEAIPDRYEAVRVLSFAGRIRQPVLLIHGAADMRVPLDHSVRLESALRETGNERVHLETVEGMGHSLELATLGYQFDRVVGLTTMWLAEMLG
jgi:dipeptidyl aminopeptidase/acylaminoacyl peptidase